MVLKVMIVDDIELFRRELKRLKLWGDGSGFMIAEEAQNGGEALEKLKSVAIDLVITDIRMPKVDGIELLQEIMQQRLCHCVVLLSDHSEFHYARRGLVLGAFDYMVKPVEEQELKQLLVRAKEFIEEKRETQNRLRQLEQSMTTGVEMHYPLLELNQLVELVASANPKAVDYASHIVDVVYIRLNADLIPSGSLLNSITHDLIEKLLQNRSWLKSFVDTEQIQAACFSKHNSLIAMRGAFVSLVGRLVTLFELLIPGQQEEGMVEQVCRCVLENIDQEMSLQRVADMIFMNRTYISEAFKQKAGISFTEYLNTAKMERAKMLLMQASLRNYEIAELLGFKDVEYFGKLFKKHTGYTPTQYRLVGGESHTE